MRLTEEQQAVVRHGLSHARVSAVAGSGKTATMVARVLHLLDTGVAPRRILVLMFNVSARQDFAQRLSQAASGRYPQLPEVRTFHSLGLRITRSCVQRGVLPDYRLVTEDWRMRSAAQAALEAAVKRQDKAAIAGDPLSKEQIESFVNFIDRVKADVADPAELLESQAETENKQHFAAAYQLFERQREQAKVRYYADLVHDPVMALVRDPAVSDWLADHMDHIILDEYQDINEAQQQLVKAVAGWRAKVMAVGDVDQCVYEWRGARPDYIVERFFQDFPGASRYTLSRSFRFGHRLSLLANHAIQRNQRRDKRICLSAPGTPDTRIEHFEEGANPHPILPILARWRDSDRQLSDAAVLVRLYSMTVPIELALLHHHIPYRLEGHDTLFQCPEIRSFIGHLRLADGSLFGSNDAASLLEAMLTVPQLGFKRQEIGPIVKKMQEHARKPERILQDAIHGEMHPYQKKRLSGRAQLWSKLQRAKTDKAAWLVLKDVVELGELYEFFRWANPTYELAEDKIQMCESFIAYAHAANRTVSGFLKLIDEMQRPDESVAADTLHITSIHRAKGLEWPLVILPGLAEGLFPYYQELDEEAPVEDERRLFYVGCTRAKEQLCLLHPRDTRYQGFESQGYERPPMPSRCTASRFLYEARFELSELTADALANNSPPQRDFYLPTTANSYLAAIGSRMRISAKAFQSKTSADKD